MPFSFSSSDQVLSLHRLHDDILQLDEVDARRNTAMPPPRPTAGYREGAPGIAHGSSCSRTMIMTTSAARSSPYRQYPAATTFPALAAFMRSPSTMMSRAIIRITAATLIRVIRREQDEQRIDEELVRDRIDKLSKRGDQRMLAGNVAIQKIRKGSDGEQRQHEQIAQIKGEGGNAASCSCRISVCCGSRYRITISGTSRIRITDNLLGRFILPPSQS